MDSGYVAAGEESERDAVLHSGTEQRGVAQAAIRGTATAISSSIDAVRSAAAKATLSGSSSLDSVRSAATKASRQVIPFARASSEANSAALSLLSPSASEESESLYSHDGLKGVGGGLAGSALLQDRHRKVSRYCRLRRGTCCFRFTLLMLSVLVVFSGYYAFDLPSITASSLEEEMNVDNTKLGILFSVYALPNAILPMLSGAFFSKVGKWRGVVVIAAVITLGICITGIGTFARSYPVMVFGRAVYGCGGESVYVGIEILVTKWFKGAEVGLAYGIVQAMGQAGSFSAFYLAPPLLAAFGDVKFVYATSMFVTATALAGLALARLLEKTAYTLKPADAVRIERAAGDAGDMHHSSGVMHSGSTALAAAVLDGIEHKKARDARQHAHGRGHAETHAGNAPTTVADHRAVGQPKEAGDPEQGAAEQMPTPTPTLQGDEVAVVEEFNDYDEQTDELTDELNRISPCPNIKPLHFVWTLLGLSHLRRLRWDFWCVLASIACYSSAFYTFLAFGNVWLQTVYGYSDSESGRTVGIVSIFSMVVSPLVGVLLDKKGGQRYAAFIAMTGACFWFGIMGFTRAPPIVTVLFAGACYAVLPSALYPLLVETVPDESFTVVYAIVNASINLVLTAAYYFAGAITNIEIDVTVAAVAPRRASPGILGNDPEDTPKGDFDPVFIMFCSITGVGMITTGLLARQQWLGRVHYQPVGHGHH